MVDFRIEKYDIGGNNAIACDGKLTGSEVKKAQKDGWTVWEGYSLNDTQPENTKAKEKEAKKEYMDFDTFDRGGKNAIAGDGVLNGEEVKNANRAGYPYIIEGDTKEETNEYPSKALRHDGSSVMSFSRDAYNKGCNKLVKGLATTADLLTFFPAFWVDMGRAIIGTYED